MRFNIDNHWYQPRLSWLSYCLSLFSWLFRLVVSTRYFLYQQGFLKSYRAPVPVIVVGNIAVGGTGKTPMVIWLAESLREKGLRPGIVSRGYGGRRHNKPYQVQPTDNAAKVGDEALLLHQRTACPVVIGIDRASAVQVLLQNTNCNIVISDDGLQHYSLHRDIEITMVDGIRRFGNEACLPAGPLREPIKRLQKTDFVVVTHGGPDDAYSLSLTNMIVHPLHGVKHRQTLSCFENKVVHAVAGIGHPERFFVMLEKAGLRIIRHIFPDHYRYQESDLVFEDALDILMTEKDAVKCQAFANKRFFAVGIEMQPNQAFQQAFWIKLGAVYEKNNVKLDAAAQRFEFQD